MKFLFRSTLLLALLASLAYGSYAFGRYVLSQYLFKEGIKANPNSVLAAGDGITSNVTGGGVMEGSYKGTRPQADVKVLPAEVDGVGPQAPSTESLERQTRAAGTDTTSGSRESAPNSSVPQDTDTPRNLNNRSRSGDKNDVLTGGYRGLPRELREGEEGTDSRRRRRRRRRTTEREKTDTSASTPSADTGTKSGVIDTPVNSGDAGGRTAAERPANSESHRASHPVTKHAPSNDSPVPVPEKSGGGGGDSPVPVPE